MDLLGASLVLGTEGRKINTSQPLFPLKCTESLRGETASAPSGQASTAEDTHRGR